MRDDTDYLLKNDLNNSNVITNHNLLIYQFDGPITGKTIEGLYLSSKVAFLMKTKDNKDNNQLISTYITQINSKLLKTTRLYLHTITEDKLESLLPHKYHIKNNLNGVFNQILNQSEILGEFLPSDPVLEVFFHSLSLK